MADAPGSAAGPGDAAPPERRLHPLSWLFVLLQQLRQFIVPLLVLVVFGRGDDNAPWGLLAIVVLALVSVWRYYTYRYRIEADSLVIRSGLLERRVRQIPFARIHNVALHQGLLHRLFGVAEVRLESAGGEKPEAEMRVLRLDQATALEALVRRQATIAPHTRDAGATDATQADDDRRELLRLPPAELVRLGLISNRGLLVVGAAFAALTQVQPGIIARPIERGARAVAHRLDLLDLGLAQWVVALAMFALAAVLVLQLLSVALALLQYAGFRLTEDGGRLTIERGLLTRVRTSTPRRRIQAWTLREGVLHRLFRRRGLQVDSAASRQDEQRAFRDLAPVATPDACDGLLAHLLPAGAWPPAAWRPLHPRAWWRMALPGCAFALLLAAGLGWRFGAWGLLGLAWLPWALFAAWRAARRAGYAVGEEVVALREGWWSRHWRLAELDKLQALRLRRSPMDRRCGTASLWLDTAGAGAFAPPLRIRFLPLAEARALHERLAAEVARRPLRW